MDLEHMKTAWKKEKSFEDKRLTEADIKAFLHKKSRDISRLFSVGLTFDIAYKGIIGISFLGILILFSGNRHIILMIAVILLGLIWAIIYQWTDQKGAGYRSIRSCHQDFPGKQSSLLS